MSNKLIYISGCYSAISKKDLNACTPIVHKKLNSSSLEQTITHFQTLKSKFQYIPYSKHLKGLSHHSNLGPSRRPVKCYNYVIEVLKGMRGAFSTYESKPVINHVLINTSAKGPKGARKGGRGRRFPEDSLKHKILLILTIPTVQKK